MGRGQAVDGTSPANPSGYFGGGVTSYRGISELDYFAAHALMGIADRTNPQGGTRAIASVAWDLAEAMVDERKKRDALRNAGVES